MTSPDAHHWPLDSAVDFLNHGAYGACPRPVLDVQQQWRDRLEAEPVRFLARDLPEHLAVARAALAAFVGADEAGLAFVTNSTTGVNTVLRSLRFQPGDEVLTTDHDYNATLNALHETAARDGARVNIARIPFPTTSPEQVVEAVVAAVTPKTRLALLSHVTSPTGLVFPMADLVRELDARGVDALVDAAHAPGMVPLDLRAIGAAYVTANAHKWLCAPKGAAFLHIREDRRHVDGRLAIRPLVTSHGANDRTPGLPPFRAEFDWTGTADPSAALSIPAALEFMAGLVPGGWPELMASNHALALAGRDLLCAALDIEPPAPDSLIGSLAAVPLPDDVARGVVDLNGLLYDQHGIEVPVYWWPVDAVFAPHLPPPTSRRTRVLRISAQRYNDLDQYARLAAVLGDLRGQSSPARSASSRSATAE